MSQIAKSAQCTNCKNGSILKHVSQVARHHMKCFKHIIWNMKCNPRLEKGPIVSAASWALQGTKTKPEFDKAMAEMLQKFPLAAQYLQDIPHSTWALYAIEELAKKTYGQVRSWFTKYDVHTQPLGLTRCTNAT